jgi:acetoin:2,6-dichlorophenolindophenol oxidoreductase subunit alpha
MEQGDGMSAELAGETAVRHRNGYQGGTQTERDLRILARMVRIRLFEEKLQELFARGRLPGFVHLYVGEEAIAVGACSVLRDDDKITSTHRGHGHLIAKGAEPALMMAEIMGKRAGLCKGKGGSMHIADYRLGILGANGIVGGGIPIATGSALADSVLHRDTVTVCFFGDGAANQGVLLEALNLSSIWRLPVVYLCENNGYTEWMRTSDITAGEIADRGIAFGAAAAAVDGNDVLAVQREVAAAVDRARDGGGPSLIEAKSFRMLAHNEGEEAFSGQYRSQTEIDLWKSRDPVAGFSGALLARPDVTQDGIDAIWAAERRVIADAVDFAVASPEPDPGEAGQDLYAAGDAA